jgi:RNase P protein component
MRVRNEKEKHRWINTFYVIYDTYKNFINEWSYGTNIKTGKKKRWRTHRKLRSAFVQLDNEIKNEALFVYLINPNVPKTTNDVEGGVNKWLRKRLGDHPGLVYSKQRKMVEELLWLNHKKPT